jgi:hypothetical protein
MAMKYHAIKQEIQWKAPVSTKCKPLGSHEKVLPGIFFGSFSIVVMSKIKKLKKLSGKRGGKLTS